MNKRLAILEKMIQSGSGDSFAYYALALEYRKERRIDAALDTFNSLKQRDSQYLPMYLMAAQMLVAADRGGEAQCWIESGIELARAKGDAQALGELEAELVHAISTRIPGK